MIPLKYNTRNLRMRWVSTLMTVLATGGVVWSSCLLFGLVAGLQHSLNVSGDPLDLIVIRKGSTGENDGGFDVDKAQELETIPGIARDADGRPLVALELIHLPLAQRLNGDRTNLTVRGVDPVSSPELRPEFHITTGRMFNPGVGECIVGHHLSKRFKNAQLGATLSLGEKESYRVVGTFTAGGSAAESEVWVDRKVLERNVAREGTISSVQMRAASAQEREAIRQLIETDNRFKLQALRETDYFASQNRSSLFLKVSGTIIAVLLTIGAMFAAANTMFSAVTSRTREIGTLRALGFSRPSILLSFLGESLLLCTLGGIVGLVATLPLSFLTFGTMNSNTFAESTFSFRLDGLVAGVAIAMTLAMGLFGGLFPAIRAVRLNVINALREL
jgi:putative ABC transport system permease protein